MTLELRGITRRHSGQAVVEDVTLTVEDGEFLALVGPSGAGKTTLLRIIAGLEPDYDGRLLIGGRNMIDVPARYRNIGFVFQNYALFRHLDVADNVAFGLRALPAGRRPSRATIRQRVADLLELVQVPELARRRPAQLSGGQRQRVALARALATEPELLLLDEPFGALDPMVRKDIRTWLRGLHDRLGLTSIFVTHDQAEAAELADRLAVLCGGRLVQVGSPRELDAHPASPFVVHFLGECIRFEGEVREGRFHPDAADIEPVETEAQPGRAVALIRPYDLLLRHGGAAQAVGSRPSGGFVHVRVRIGRREIDVLAPAGTQEVPAGTVLSLQVRRAHVFPLAAPPIEIQPVRVPVVLNEKVLS